MLYYIGIFPDSALNLCSASSISVVSSLIVFAVGIVVLVGAGFGLKYVLKISFIARLYILLFTNRFFHRITALSFLLQKTAV